MTIGLIGYGDLGVQFENLIRLQSANFDFIYFDDIAFADKIEQSYPFADYLKEDFVHVHFIVALGYKHLNLKQQITKELLAANRKLATFVHASAIINPSVIIDPGTVIYPGVVLDKNVHVGYSSVLNLSVTISHDTKIDDCCFIAPGTTISGFSKIGKRCFIGVNSTISDNVSISDDVILGAASLVLKNITEPGIYFGSPVRKKS